MEWLRDVWQMSAIAAGLIGLVGIVYRLSRCRHPNPHYQREPPSYICYECGKTWSATVRDNAWAPTGIRQSFRGYDPALAARASTRAAIVSEQQKLLAASRTGPTRTPAPKRRARRKVWTAQNVTDINTRRPA
jgi:hypothetical protein